MLTFNAFEHWAAHPQPRISLSWVVASSSEIAQPHRSACHLSGTATASASSANIAATPCPCKAFFRSFEVRQLSMRETAQFGEKQGAQSSPKAPHPMISMSFLTQKACESCFQPENGCSTVLSRQLLRLVCGMRLLESLEALSEIERTHILASILGSGYVLSRSIYRSTYNISPRPICVARLRWMPPPLVAASRSRSASSAVGP